MNIDLAPIVNAFLAIALLGILATIAGMVLRSGLKSLGKAIGRSGRKGSLKRNGRQRRRDFSSNPFHEDPIEDHRLKNPPPPPQNEPPGMEMSRCTVARGEPMPKQTAADRHREKKVAAYGEAGEKELFGILRHGLDPNAYEILHDIMLPSTHGDTTQIDFIVVSEFGVFVIEAKNYAGWVFADAKGKVWTQTLPKEIRNTFQNPIRQNYAHLCDLESVTGIPRNVMHPMVAFSDRAEFRTPLPPGVCYFSGIVSAIQSHREILLKAKQIPDIVAAILEWDESITPEQRASHVANLRARHRVNTR